MKQKVDCPMQDFQAENSGNDPSPYQDQTDVTFVECPTRKLTVVVQPDEKVCPCMLGSTNFLAKSQ